MPVIGQTLPTSAWRVGAANPNVFMLYGGEAGDGYVYTSPTGMPSTWTQREFIDWLPLTDGCGFGTSLVMVGNGFGFIDASKYSTDNGVTWAAGDLDINAPWEGCACKPDGSVVVAVGGDGTDGVVSRSLDGGATWTAPNTVAGAPFSRVAWNGSVFIAVTYNGVTYNSSTGSSWSAGGSIDGVMWDVVARLDGTTVAVGHDGPSGETGIWVSLDNGSSWDLSTAPAGFTSQVVRIAGSDASFMIMEDGGEDYSLSADGVTWAAPLPCPDNTFGDFFGADAEASRSDSCLRATMFGDYAILQYGEAAPAAAPSAFFHFAHGDD